MEEKTFIFFCKVSKKVEAVSQLRRFFYCVFGEDFVYLIDNQLYK